MDTSFPYCDQFGPFKVIHLYEPSLPLKAALVVDNVALGPAIGGIRMAEDVTTEECFRLARAMTYKNAAAGLPHGGGKAVIWADPKMPPQRKQEVVRAFAQGLRNEESYVFAPDMGMDEQCMAWIRDEVGRVVGLPSELGGIPLDELGATGWGLSHAVEVIAGECGFPVAGARFVVQGFGAVGKHAARFLGDKGAVLVGASDSRGAIRNEQGLDVARLIALKQQGGSVVDYPDASAISADELIEIQCELWIPAARPDVINRANVGRLNTRAVIQGANIPCTPEAEALLHRRGVLCLPDFIGNAGGVICASMEYHGATQATAFEAIEEKILRNTEQMLAIMKAQSLLPRQAAESLAQTRLQRAMAYRRYSLFSTAPHFL
ncbi:Glu/Leu/Phe/Val dehydrogenase [Ferrimonas sediminicola]|uniref:Glutamate dehydrogenase n=1 Tax=Ferrimonas sediminicola TaxID=2569538 RepID=A0A4V5NV26_9GAMM|nr:Glu/Leu/Phe/Val dehydrogenase [Ferrimonas sediminicola]TKB48854.1 Glu/Leu/Phe/Val dehydrogenase [Ferrimonas sediminicola]